MDLLKYIKGNLQLRIVSEQRRRSNNITKKVHKTGGHKGQKERMNFSNLLCIQGVKFTAQRVTLVILEDLECGRR